MNANAKACLIEARQIESRIPYATHAAQQQMARRVKALRRAASVSYAR